MLLLNRGAWILCALWAQPWGFARRGRRFRSERGQAVMEYFVLFMMVSILAAVFYRLFAPFIEQLLVKMARWWIAMNVAGES